MQSLISRIQAKLDSTPKRLLAAAALSAGIVFSVQAFASSSYVATQKIQIESARGQHCQQWSYQKTDDGTKVSCAKWSER